MAAFRYEALDANGTRRRGELTAADEAQALDQIAQQGLTPLTILPGRAEPWWARDISFGEPTVPLADQERTLSILAVLLDARLPLPRALRFCAEQTRRRPLRRALNELADAIEDGQSLEDALTEIDHGLPQRLVTLLVVGDRANKVAETADAIAKQLAVDLKMTRDLRSALVYPAILVLMALVVLAVLIFYLAPTLLPVFDSSDLAVPAVLAGMAAFGDTLRTAWALVVPMALLTLVTVVYAWRRLGGHVLSVAIRLPIIGPSLRRLETLRLLQAFRIMLTGGAHLTVALETAGDTVQTPVFRNLIGKARRRIEDGASLHAAFADADLLDPTARLMIEVGEEGDQLANSVSKAADTLAIETTRGFASAVRLLTPFLTLLIGGTVAAIMMTTIGAIMDLNDLTL